MKCQRGFVLFSEEIGTFKLGRTTLYRRLIPVRRNSSEGKRHVHTVPVMLARATYDGRDLKKKGLHFAFGVQRMMHQLSAVLPHDVVYISPDDKATIPLGIPAVAKQQ